MGAFAQRRPVGFQRWCCALVLSLGCFLPSGYAAPRAQPAQIAGMFDPTCAAAIKEFSDYLALALLETGAVGPKFTLFGPLEERFDAIVEGLQLGVGTRFRGLTWDAVYKTDGESVRFEVRSSNPAALCAELTAPHTLALMGSGEGGGTTQSGSNGASGAASDGDEATLSEVLKTLKEVFAEELRNLRDIATGYLSALWDEVLEELRALLPGTSPGTIGGGGGGGGITISLPGIDFSDVTARFSKKGGSFGFTLWRSEDSEQTVRCELDCTVEGDVSAELRYRNEIAPGVLFTVAAYTTTESSGLSLELRGGF